MLDSSKRDELISCYPRHTPRYLFHLKTIIFRDEMERADGLLLSGAQQQHQYFNSSDHATTAHKGMDMEYNALTGAHVQDRVQFEADKQAVYR